jgi:hypothetical protein
MSKGRFGLAVALASTVLLQAAALEPVHAAEDASSSELTLDPEALAAVAQLSETILAPDVSFTAQTTRLSPDNAGRLVPVVHELKVAVHRPDRLHIEASGQEGRRRISYDGHSIEIDSPGRRDYVVTAIPERLPKALNEELEKLQFDFPLLSFFEPEPYAALTGGIIAVRQIGTVSVDGIVCRRLLLSQPTGTEVELWVENNSTAIPHRVMVADHGTPNFTADFAHWDNHPGSSDPASSLLPLADTQ